MSGPWGTGPHVTPEALARVEIDRCWSQRLDRYRSRTLRSTFGGSGPESSPWRPGMGRSTTSSSSTVAVGVIEAKKRWSDADWCRVAVGEVRDGAQQLVRGVPERSTLRWHRDNLGEHLRLKTLRRTAEEADSVSEGLATPDPPVRRPVRLLRRGHGPRPAADHVVPLTRGGRHTIGNLPARADLAILQGGQAPWPSGVTATRGVGARRCCLRLPADATSLTRLLTVRNPATTGTRRGSWVRLGVGLLDCLA